MAYRVRVGTAENKGESETFTFLEKELPDSMILLTNVGVPDGKRMRDLDAIVLSSTGAQIIEIKDWMGKLKGHETGDWTQDGVPVKNPVFQVNQSREIMRNFVFHNAKKIFNDPRASYGVSYLAILVLVSEHADTAEVKVKDLDHFYVCKSRKELLPALAKQRMRTRQFLQTGEIHKIAELLGASPSDLDKWEQSLTPHKCRCGKENRPSAKFCIQCGTKF